LPHYYYICDSCGHKFDEIRSLGDHARRCPKCDSSEIGRDYQTEFSGVSVIGDFGEGYNYGIDEHYDNKADLLKKIRAKGFEPSRYNELKPVRRRLYADEETVVKQNRKDKYPNVVVED